MNITPEAVAKVANKLMKAHGATTTLEVKKQLRKMGFIAFQNDVSAFMDALCLQECWVFEFNGLFRTYRKPRVTEWIIMIAPPCSLN